MTTDSNPYHASGLDQSPSHGEDTITTQLRWLFSILIGYYVLSCLTLPLANEFWLGELPVFAIPQLPKSWTFSTVRQQLILFTHMLGIGRGSASPDLIAMKPWAFAILFTAPSVIALCITATCRRLKPCWPWVWRLLAIATVDAAVTIWFHRTSKLSIF
jgi:hypothetical protein